ncbi:hypothetical protein BVRB_6g144680 [Beta vulgaris subsp. vulgaris]|nr:hypothetical protein BVRB_6g144680 [Beta vulgaris subsp. vulgaris]
MRMTRKRAKLAFETDSARNNVSVGLLELSTGRGISSDQPKIDVPIANAQKSNRK